MKALNKIVLILVCSLVSYWGLSQTTSNKGKDFWVGYGHHQSMEKPCPPVGGGPQADEPNQMNMLLYFSTEAQAATVTVTIDSSGPFFATWYRKTYIVPPYSVVTSEIIPKGSINVAAVSGEPLSNPNYDARLRGDEEPGGNGGSGLFRKKGIHIESTVPIVAYAHIYASANSGATMLLPTDAWGYSYVSLNSNQSYASNCYSWMYVVASKDNTVIEITPSVKTRAQDQTGLQPGVPKQITLMKGQIYQVIGANTASNANGTIICGTGATTGYNLSGTIVKSIASPGGECNPIAVFAGSSRTTNPISCGSGGGDNDNQQLFPYHTWGRRYLTAPFSNSTTPSTLATSMFRIAVKDPTTIVRRNGVQIPLVNLQNNNYYTYESSTADYIESDKPIMLAQYMTGGSCIGGGLGDPEMVVISPIEQGIKGVVFYRNNFTAISVNYVTLIVPTAGVPSLRIDNSTTFSHTYVHPNLPGYTVVIKRWSPAGKAQSLISCDSAFNGITYGLGSVESYGYNIGAYLKNLNAASNIHNLLDTSNGGNNAHLFTCINTPVKLSVLMRYSVTKLVWNISSLGSVVTPNANVTMDPASNFYAGTVLLNGITYYKYDLPGTYTFNTAGLYNIPISATSPSLVDNCNNTEDVAISVEVKSPPINDFTITHPTQCTKDSIYISGDTNTLNGFTVNQWLWTLPGSISAYSKDTTLVLPPGNYTVKLNSASSEGCASVEVTKNFTVVPVPTSDFSVSPTTVCIGSSINIADASAYTGGTSINTWYWDYGNTQTATTTAAPYNYTYSAAGTFNIKHVTKVSNLCISDTTVKVVHISPAPSIGTVNAINPTACGSSTGSIELNGLGNNVSYLVNYLKNSIAQSATISANASGVLTISNLPSGTYSNIIVTLTGCVSNTVGPVILTDPSAPTTPTISTNSPVCVGSNLNLNSSTTTTGAITYAWTGPNGFTSANQNPVINNITLLDAGVYNVTATLNNCTSATGTTTVTVNSIPIIGGSSSTHPTSCGTNTGTITLTGLNSSTAYGIHYTLGSSNQTVTLTSNSAGEIIIPNLGVGTYSNVYVVLNGCNSLSVGPFVLSDPNPPITPIANNNGPLCAGTTLNLSSSTASVGTITYAWTGPNGFTSNLQNPSLTSPTVSATGTYNVTVQINGCTSAAGSTSVVINEIPVQPTASSNTPICSGTALNLTSNTSTTGSITYAWTGPNGFSSSLQNPSISSATTLASGVYQVTATKNSCTSTVGAATVVVNQTPNISSGSTVNPTSCLSSTGSIILNGLVANTTFTVNYTFAGNPVSANITSSGSAVATISNLAAGTYSNIFVVSNGCTSNIVGPFTLIDPLPPVTPTVGSNSPICSGSNLNLTSSTSTSGTISYSWTGPNGFTSNVQNPTIASASVLASGTYSTTATLNGCTSVAAAINILVKPTPNITGSSSNNPTNCGTSTGSIVLNGLSASTSYTVDYLKNSIPQTGTVNSDISGNVSILNLSAGNYSNLTLTLNGCTSNIVGPFTIADPNPPATPTIGSNSPICSNGTLNLTSSTTTTGSITYSWTGPNGFTSSLQNPSISSTTTAANGIYTVTATLNNCISLPATTSVVINISPAISSSTSINPINCNSSTGSITLNGLQPNISYDVNYLKNGSPQTANLLTDGAGNLVINNLPAGNYTNISVTLFSCTSNTISSVTLIDPPLPATPSISNNSPLCVGGNLNLISNSSTAGVVYSWTGPNSFTSNLQNPIINNSILQNTGNYTVTVTLNNCTSSATTSVTINPLPFASFKLPAKVCIPDGSATFVNESTVSNSSLLNYVWDFGDFSATSTAINPTHNYITITPKAVKLTVTSSDGCVKDTTQILSNLFLAPIALFTVSPDTLCQGTNNIFTDLSIAISSTIQNWSWNFNDGTTSTTQNPTKKYLLPGNYNVSLVVTNAAGCTSLAYNKNVIVYLQPIIDAGPSFVVTQGTRVTFNPTANDSTVLNFLWTPPGLLSNSNILRPTYNAMTDQKFTLTATGQGNCIALDTLTVKILKPVKVPNAFSPNGDGVNDKWIITNLADYPGAFVEVFNRDGQMVFQSFGYNVAWDGTIKGKPLPVATYYYIITLKNGFKPIVGYVTILK